MLDTVGSETLAWKDEIGRLLSREEGKTLPEGICETVRAGDIFKVFAGEVLRQAGEKIASVRPGWTSRSRASPSVSWDSSRRGTSRLPRGAVIHDGEDRVHRAVEGPSQGPSSPGGPRAG
jgi:hypothetical protein